jgi:hypothetical protein
MAYVPGFSTDIFVSYAHIDNHDIDDYGTRWVEKFHKGLQGLVDTSAGERLDVWRDPKLHGASVFSKELEDRLQSTAILVTVVSSGYLGSSWCKREREIFAEAAAQTGGLDVGNSRRIIRVLKNQIAHEELPEILRPTLGFRLFTVDDQSGEETDYLFDPRPEAGKLYRGELCKIARAITNILKQMRDGVARTTDPERTTVYLAETTSDLFQERESLRRELDMRGCLVVPREPLPHDAERLDPMIRS